jgi:PQQ-like domain
MPRRPATAAILALIVGAALGAVAPGHAEATACKPQKNRSLVLLSARTGATVRAFPDVAGVSAVVTDGAGGWFASGSFTCTGSARRSSLVRLDHAGRVDPDWRPALPAGQPAVSLLARSGTTLYAAGEFGVEALDAATGARRWLVRIGHTPSAPGVLSLVANDRAVYLGGGFQTVGGSRLPALAALDAGTGRPLAWHVPSLRGSFPAPVVDALALAGTRLYLGGNTIVTVDGQHRPGFAAVDARTGRLSPWEPGTAPGLNPGYGVGDVESILVAGGLVFSGGHDGFGIVSARTGAIAPWMLKLHGGASRFASYGSTVYLGGNVRSGFGGIGRQVRNDLAAIDVAKGRVLPFAPRLTNYVSVSAMAADRDEVLVGGDFFQSFG